LKIFPKMKREKYDVLLEIIYDIIYVLTQSS